MNTLKDIPLKKAYDSDRDDLLRSFYIPAMSTGVRYKRLAGFFSSGILSAAARGIADFIQNEGKMQLIVGVDIHADDYEAMQKSLVDPESYIVEHFKKNFSEIETLLRDDKVEALGWMLANGKMEIRLGLVPGGGLFHLKVGIIEDAAGNKVSFSGSDNETPSAWKHNVEEFKVFRGWIPDEAEYFLSDEEKFDRFWSGNGIRAKVVDLPEAIKEKLIRAVPQNKRDLKIFKATSLPHDQKRVVSNQVPRPTNLRPHQEAAITALETHAGRGILAMATGSGKTITALEFVRHASNAGPLCTVIALPYLHLVKQWIDNDIRPMFPDVPIVEVHGQSPDWKSKLSVYLAASQAGTFKQLFIVGLYGSLATSEFTDMMLNSGINSKELLLVADEVHNAGATEAQKALLPIYDKRVGLSATYERHFDDEGTEVIKDYFGDVVYTYDLAQAISDGYLTPYEYFPHIVRLTEEEHAKYKDISVRISRAIASGKSPDSDIMGRADIKRLLITRSKLIKNAANKISELDALLREMKKKEISNTLIYCDDMKQLDKAQAILNDLGIINHKFTQVESLPTREGILENFAKGVYRALVAVKCLDEGVDVPATKTAVIVASTSNPREFIQRRGRVLRKYPGKSMAVVHDFVVLPPPTGTTASKAEKAIIEGEFKRVRDFIDTASNKADIYAQFLAAMREFGVYL